MYETYILCVYCADLDALLEIARKEGEQQAAPTPKVRPPGVLRLSCSGMMKAKAEREAIKQIADKLKADCATLTETLPTAQGGQNPAEGQRMEHVRSTRKCAGEHHAGEEGQSAGQGGPQQDIMEIGCEGGWRLPRASRLSHSHRSRVTKILASGPGAFWTPHPSQGRAFLCIRKLF